MFHNTKRTLQHSNPFSPFRQQLSRPLGSHPPLHIQQQIGASYRDRNSRCCYATKRASNMANIKDALRKPEVHSLKTFIDPRIPGVNDAQISRFYTPLVLLMRRFFTFFKLRKDIGFFEEQASQKYLKQYFLTKYQELYESRNILSVKGLCTPVGYSQLRSRVNELIKTKRSFPSNGEFKVNSIAHVATATISQMKTTFSQITVKIELPNGEHDYVVFEKEMDADSAPWKFAGWVDPEKAYRKPSVSEIIGINKEKSY